MKYYSGFSLENDTRFFALYLDKSEYSIAGFSYGAIRAIEATLDAIKNGIRVDRLQLLSPAFFQTETPKFKRLQLLAYRKDSKKYLQNFMQLCFEPYSVQECSHKETRAEELRELLEYEYSQETLQKIVASGVKLEVYLGGEDKIINPQVARAFFLKSATVTYIKKANHFLQIGE